MAIGVGRILSLGDPIHSGGPSHAFAIVNTKFELRKCGKPRSLRERAAEIGFSRRETAVRTTSAVVEGG